MKRESQTAADRRLLARVRRRLARHGLALRRTRAAWAREIFGAFHLVDVATELCVAKHVSPEALARVLGAGRAGAGAQHHN
jgi:hypothetical protein